MTFGCLFTLALTNDEASSAARHAKRAPEAASPQDYVPGSVWSSMAVIPMTLLDPGIGAGCPDTSALHRGV